MKMKLLGAAVATALLTVSTASFAQTGAAAGGQSNAGPGRDLQNGPAARSGQGHNNELQGTSGVTTTAPAAGTSAVSRCDTLAGDARTRCLRDERASGGTSMSPQDQKPARENHAVPGNTIQGPAAGSGSASGR
jgi:hypothetical protein